MGIYIPKSVKNIGEKAFKSASALKVVEFHSDSKLASIGEKAFKNCESLCSINIPKDVEIKDDAFIGGKYNEKLFKAGETIDSCTVTSKPTKKKETKKPKRSTDAPTKVIKLTKKPTEDIVKLTKKPKVTAAPTKKPKVTVAPTKKPKVTVAPTKKPKGIPLMKF